jgi:hypothetical protein
MFVKTLLGVSPPAHPPPLRRLENTAAFSRACHAFGDGSIPHDAISVEKVERMVE